MMSLIYNFSRNNGYFQTLKMQKKMPTMQIASVFMLAYIFFHIF